jgi:hypothetical protein
MRSTLLALALALCGCATTTATDTATIANAVVTCTQTTCGQANTAPTCAALETDVLACVTAATTGNPAVCLAGIPSAISTGYADLICVLAEIQAPSAAASPAIVSAPVTARAAAAKVLASQGVLIRKAGP